MPPLRTVLTRLPSTVKTTLAIPAPRTRALKLRAAQPVGASRRALTAPMRSPSTICEPVSAGPPPLVVVGAVVCGSVVVVAGGLSASGFDGGLFTGGSQASPTPLLSASAWSAFIVVGQLSQASTTPSPSVSGEPGWACAQVGGVGSPAS